jgi:hypothetical protein
MKMGMSQRVSLNETFNSISLFYVQSVSSGWFVSSSFLWPPTHHGYDSPPPLSDQSFPFLSFTFCYFQFERAGARSLDIWRHYTGFWSMAYP